MKLVWFARLSAIAFCLFLLALSIGPDSFTKSVFSALRNDKLIHAVSSFFLIILGALALPRLKVLYICMFISLLSLGVEVLQSAFGRNADLLDFLFNLIGIGGAVLAFGVSDWRRRQGQVNDKIR